MEAQLQPQRKLIELDQVLAARDRAEAEQTTTMGKLRTAGENLRRLGALIPFCSSCQFTMTIPADPAVIPIVTDRVVELLEEQYWPAEDVAAVQLIFLIKELMDHVQFADGGREVQMRKTKAPDLMLASK